MSQPPQYLMLAFDHRGHFERLLVEQRPPDTGTFGAIALAKTLIYRAARAVRASRPTDDGLGVFVDEQYGAALAVQARADGLVLAMPAEQSDQPELRLEFGPRYGERINRFRPDLVKVLIRHDVTGDRAAAERQADRLAGLSRWCTEAGHNVLVELLVPGRERADHLHRTTAAVADLVDHGVRANVWKVEAPQEPAQYAELAEVCRSASGPQTRVVLLGGGAGLDETFRDLGLAAAAGFDGFAVGRSIWDEPLRRWLRGQATDADTVNAIAERYRACVQAYRSAAVPVGAEGVTRQESA